MPDIPQEVVDQVGRIVSAYDLQIASIRTDPELSPAGRATRLAQLYWATQAEVEQIRERWERTAADSASSLTRELFGTPSASGADAIRSLFGEAPTRTGADAISTRDADDRVSRIEDPNEAIRLLERAEINDDEVLVRAIARRAYEHASSGFLGGGWSPVLDAYLEKRPDVAAKIQQLEAARRSDLRSGILGGFLFSVAMPREVEQMGSVARNAARAGGQSSSELSI
ncbi:hypothetical protein [Aeromicrobium sp. 179-A 4D2 NHS]|uniref:hypothetical protein n=1 Tax=Aeromicrobium sp. 179-A 4D2 NHS TaxID=3142375 RepID=UPI0039A209FB